VRAEAVRRAAEATAAAEEQRAAAAKAADNAAMSAARLKEAEKDVFKLERQLEEREKAFISYQVRAVCARSRALARNGWADARERPWFLRVLVRVLARVACAGDGGAAD
jgi:hypothetical protein